MTENDFKLLIQKWALAIINQATEENLVAFVRSLAPLVESELQEFRNAEAQLRRDRDQGIRSAAATRRQRALATQYLQVYIVLQRYALSALNQKRQGLPMAALRQLIAVAMVNALRLPVDLESVSKALGAGRAWHLQTHRTATHADAVWSLTRLALLAPPSECRALHTESMTPLFERIAAADSVDLFSRKKALREKILAAIELSEEEAALLRRFL